MRMIVNINYDTWFLKDEPWNYLLNISGKEVEMIYPNWQFIRLC